ncbi:Periplasmic binding protein-like I protein [Raphanus sativus]|nr:Periplasmic binding protein-like I protein [Raphanus sativus]
MALIHFFIFSYRFTDTSVCIHQSLQNLTPDLGVISNNQMECAGKSVLSRNSSTSPPLPQRPSSVNVGALFTYDSFIGRAAKPAFKAAMDDVNADQTVLKGTKLNIVFQDSNCSGFIGTMGVSWNDGKRLCLDRNRLASYSYRLHGARGFGNNGSLARSRCFSPLHSRE